MTERTQRNNITLAFITLVGVVIIVSVIGFFTFRKGTEIIQGQAEATEYRVSSKVPGRILKFFVSEGDQVKAGDTLAILEAPDVMAKLSQALGTSGSGFERESRTGHTCRATSGGIRNVAKSEGWKRNSREIIPTGQPPV